MVEQTTEREARGTAAGGRGADPVTEIARGRRPETPFLLVGGTALVVGAIAALIAGVALLVWWLG